jgi:pyruvate/2-oxoglutarate dehydrogenase complex dihydrolipoamide dehydrogenase (E3) component
MLAARSRREEWGRLDIMAEEHYNGIVIGAGQAGVPLSTALARAGWETALIEREHVGGR